MSKKSKMANIELKISQEPNSPVMKLIKQTGIEGIALDVIKAIMSPLINLIANRDGDDVGSALNKSITLIAASDPKNQSELMLGDTIGYDPHHLRQKRTAIRSKLLRRSNDQQLGQPVHQVIEVRHRTDQYT